MKKLFFYVVALSLNATLIALIMETGIKAQSQFILSMLVTMVIAFAVAIFTNGWREEERKAKIQKRIEDSQNWYKEKI